MTAFRLSDNINKGKVFITQFSEMETRWDPIMIQYKRKTQNFLYKPIKLKSLLKKLPQYGANQQGIPRNSINVPRYIRITDIDESGLLKNELGVTAKIIEDKYLLKNNDILFARSGATVGKAYIHKNGKVSYPCFFAGYMIRFVLDENKISPDFLFAFTQLGVYKEWTKAIQRAAGQPNINAEEYKALEIPLPDFLTQKRIVNKIQSAYQQKEAKEKQAKDLLASIDDYMLEALGITLSKPDNSLQNRIFKIPFSKVTGNRFDPKLYDNNSQKLFATVENSPIPKIPLKSLITQSVSGEWGLDENASLQEDQYERCVVIRATEFDNDFNLNIENSRVKYRQIIKDKLKLLDVQENDLLLEKSGGSPDQPVGRIAILQKELLAEYHPVCFSNFVQKIRPDETLVLPEYLFCFLKTIHNIKITEVMQSQTSGIRNLIMREYFNQSIILPDKTKQKEISDTANKMRNDAFRLFQQADKEFQKASREVAQVILGEENI